MATDTRRHRATEGAAPPMRGDRDSLKGDLSAALAEYGLKLRELVWKEDLEKRTLSFSLKVIPASLDAQGELFDETDGDQ